MTLTNLSVSTLSTQAFGVYVHWPFCLSKCPYCDFNSHVRHGGIDQSRYVQAYLREIEAMAARTPGRTVSTIFFGGGTPSLMQPETVAAILDGIGRHWTVAPDVEVTLEANPTSVEAERFRGFRTAGVNRVSLGVQALDDASLKDLGRLHTAEEALKAVAIARSVFDRYSFDLIYARPGQTPDAWAQELRRAIAEAAEHLSLYQLTIEADTPFFALHKSGKLITPNDDIARELYDMTQEICDAAGLSAYEISNHSRAGAESRHNLVYWRGDDYAGIGPGAHGRIEQDGRRYRDGHREAARKLADARGSARPRTGGRRGAHPRGARRRISSDGIAPRRGNRSAALTRHCPVARSTRSGSPSCWRKARSRPPPTGGCVSPRRPFRFWMRWLRISRLKSSDVFPSSGGRGNSGAGKRFRRGLTICPPPEATCITASPRSLVPSGLNRKIPSIPEKPEGLVSDLVGDRLPRLDSVRAPRPVRSNHRPASPFAPGRCRSATDSAARNWRNRRGRAPHKDRPASTRR